MADVNEAAETACSEVREPGHAGNKYVAPCPKQNNSACMPTVQSGFTSTEPIRTIMLAEHRPNCQPPHSLHETTQTQILPL